jgi:glycosyltransferase involved in cell wall biosynthesis
MRVALFINHFLKPTHHAIAQLIGALPSCAYTVYAKRFEDHFDLPNVAGRVIYAKGPVPGLAPGAFDLVHAIYDGRSALSAAAAARDAGVPFVLSYHGGFDLHVRIADPRYLEASKDMTEAAAAVTVPARPDLERLRAMDIRRPIEVLPVPVDVSRLPRRSAVDARRLVAVGRLVPKKGIDLAISAMGRLPCDHLIVVGDGELRAELEAEARRAEVAGRVRFAGLLPIDEALSLVASAFTLVHPARVGPDGNAEGTPQVVLLAQAMGVPVIAARSGNLEEIVEHGVTGLLVPPDDGEGLAAAVARLRRDPALLARLNRPRDVGERSLERVARRLGRIYEQALARVP